MLRNVGSKSATAGSQVSTPQNVHVRECACMQ